MAPAYIRWFSELRASDISEAGKKACNLATLADAHLPIPYGFILTSHAYAFFLQENNLTHQIQKRLQNTLFIDKKEIRASSLSIQEDIKNAAFPLSLANTIIDAYNELLVMEHVAKRHKSSLIQEGVSKVRHALRPTPVTLYSSEIPQDISYMLATDTAHRTQHIKGENVLLTKIRERWASLFSPEAIHARYVQKKNQLSMGMGIVVQRQPEGKKHGCVYTADPYTGDKHTLTIRTSLLKHKGTEYRVDKKDLLTHRDEGTSDPLTDTQILSIAETAIQIEKKLYASQYIEWVFEGNTLSITQSQSLDIVGERTSRNSVPAPETKKPKPTEQPKNTPKLPDIKKQEFKGRPLIPGTVQGKICILSSRKDLRKARKGDILVIPKRLKLQKLPVRTFGGIILEDKQKSGSLASEAHEYGIPTITGVTGVEKKLHHHDLVTLVGSTGHIFVNSVPSEELRSTVIKYS